MGFDGETSGWSSTQTITLSWDAATDETSTAAPTNSSQNPTTSSPPSGESALFGLDLLGISLLILLGAIVVL
ncbi:MAG: hypothetical protein ACM3UY_00035 [Methanocella sp.]